MIKLLGRQTSGNVQKVIFMLEEMGKAYEREDYGRQFNNTQTPEYKALNPTSKVPTLVDGKAVIWESNTILRYLASAYAPALTGATPAERTDVERWMDWILAAVNPGYLIAFKDSKKPANERAPDYDTQVKELVAQMAILDAHLKGKSHVALEKLTIADIALAPILKRCLDFPLERPAFAELDRWIKSVGERSAFQVATGAKDKKAA